MKTARLAITWLGHSTLKDITITMVPAVHSSSSVIGTETVYLGAPAGFVLAIDSAPVVYFAGDTALFGDMRLIREMLRLRLRCFPSAIDSRWGRTLP